MIRCYILGALSGAVLTPQWMPVPKRKSLFLLKFVVMVNLRAQIYNKEQVSIFWAGETACSVECLHCKHWTQIRF